MKNKDEFYVAYIDGSLGVKTKRTLKLFTYSVITIVILGAIVFSFTQSPFKNSSFELTSETKVVGIFHQSPYPMLRVEIADKTFKNILLLGFGKSSANPFLKKIKSETKNLNNAKISIEGNLIYYNGKTLLQITNDQKISLIKEKGNSALPSKNNIGIKVFEGEIIDPKCYFGVMKPGKGKIHRSCAIRCISGGIPPVLAATDNNNITQYLLLTDLNGNPINTEVLDFIGKPSKVKGMVEQFDDWYFLRIDPETIENLHRESNIY